MQIISTEGMTYIPETKSMVTEDSCLNEELNHRIGLQSHRTGMVIRMKFDQAHYRGEGSDRELTHWTYKPVEPHPIVDQLTIFND